MLAYVHSRVWGGGHGGAWGAWGTEIPGGSGACCPWSSGAGTFCWGGCIGGPLLLCPGGEIVVVHGIFGLSVCSGLRGSVGGLSICVALILLPGSVWWGSTEMPIVLPHYRIRVKNASSPWDEHLSFHNWIRVAPAIPPFNILITCSDKQSVNYFHESSEVFVIRIKSCFHWLKLYELAGTGSC